MSDTGDDFEDSAARGLTSKAISAVTFPARVADWGMGKTPIVGSTLSRCPGVTFPENFPSL